MIHSASNTLQAELLAQLNSVSPAKKQALPQDVADWIGNQMSLHVAAREAEWSGREIYVALPRPGGDAWLSIDLATGEVQYERTDRGWISYLNDLHKGRNTGFAWSVFLDVFAIACVVFCVTGTGPSAVAVQRAAIRRGRWWASGSLSRCCSQSFSSIEVAMRVGLSLTLSGAFAAQAFAADVAVMVGIPRLSVAEYHKPYVAIWLERPDQSFVGKYRRLVRLQAQGQ